MATNVNAWKPAVGDRYLKDWLVGGNGAAAAWDFKVMAGCALSGLGLANLSVAAGRVKCGGFLVDYNGDSYPVNGAATEYLYFELDLTYNSDNQVIGFTSDFALNAADSSTADFYFKVAEITSAGGVITVIENGETLSWHARPSIKILPSHFVANETGANVAIVAYSAGPPVIITATSSSATADLFAGYDIPIGFKAILLDIWASANNTFNTFSPDITGVNTATALGGGTCNTQLDITDLSHDELRYLAIEVRNLNSVLIYGGRITLEMMAV